MRLIKNGENIYRVFDGKAEASLLDRYEILNLGTELENDGGAELTEGEKCSTVSLYAKRKVKFEIFYREDKGYHIRIPLEKKERLFGLGDATRESVMIRGTRADMTVENIASYGPMAVILSDSGWAMVLDCTYRSIIDCAKCDPDAVNIDTAGGNVSLFLFRADTLKELISLVTTVTGRPALLPKFAYGLTFVQNEDIDARDLLSDIRRLRDLDIPCDTMGLEPAWMEKHYDASINKKWNQKLFPIPSWYPENSSEDFTMFYPMREMGMNLSLWLCNDYDLFYEEERQISEKSERENGDEKTKNSSDAVIIDEHLSSPIRLDRITDPDIPWFDHLKKFVDNGAAAFKLDAAYQVNSHPDRFWCRKYTDAEIHNLYPVVLVKQLYKGFAEHTGRRLLLYTAGAFLGTQQYAATWSGDTGGGQGTLVSMMNYAMCGHSNTACDIDPTDPRSIHYGFLTPWSQYFCWANWRYPWFLGPEKEEMIRFYSRLRSSLVPYLYTLAHNAYETGIPVLRPLPLVYEETDRFDGTTNAYMLGDKLYVGAFDMNLKLPEGRWVDYFTGETVEGGRDITYEIPAGRGGALFVKEGSVLVTMKPQKYILEKQHDYIISVYPGADDSFTLYEDDGFTFDYQSGGCATTKIRMENTSPEGFDLVVFRREGGFDGRPDNGHDIVRNSIPKIRPMQPQGDMTVEIHGKAPSKIIFSGKEIDFTLSGGVAAFRLDAAVHEESDARFTVKY